MDSMFELDDIKCVVGIIGNGEGQEIPVFVADYGAECPSLAEGMLRYKKITLDIVPKGDGVFTYIATVDKLMVDLSTPGTVDRILGQSDASDMLRELARAGTPELSVTYDATGEAQERFVLARAALSGYWLFVLLAEDATELVVSGNGTITQRNTHPRSRYAD